MSLPLLHSSFSNPATARMPGQFYFLAPARIQQILSALKDCIIEEKPYLRQQYDIRDLAEATGIPAYQLSAYLNQELEMNFHDFFNFFRVSYFKEFVLNSTAWRFNLAELARACGFSSRNTLAAAFKKFTGMTPSQYQKCREAGAISDGMEGRLSSFLTKSW